MIGGVADERHFRVVELNGKKVNIGGVSITSSGGPSSAARKLLTSIAHEKGLKGMKKLDLGTVHFKIQEYTRGSKQKVYGPYTGSYRKKTPAENLAYRLRYVTLNRLTGPTGPCQSLSGN